MSTEYTGTAKDLIWQLKFNGAQAAAAAMAKQMSPLLAGLQDVCIVPVPTATKRVRRRSYDQAKLLGRKLARHSRLPYRDYLRRRGQTHQVGASRRERFEQLNAAFYVVPGKHLPDREIILVDDVITTGATLEAAARVLQNAGVKRIGAIVFAQPTSNK